MALYSLIIHVTEHNTMFNCISGLYVETCKTMTDIISGTIQSTVQQLYLNSYEMFTDVIVKLEEFTFVALIIWCFHCFMHLPQRCWR